MKIRVNEIIEDERFFPIRGHIMFKYEGFSYFHGGQEVGEVISSKIWKLDLNNKVLIEVEPYDHFYPPERWLHGHVFLDGKLYIFCGLGKDYTVLDDIWCFDMLIRRWDLVGSIFPNNSDCKGIWSLSVNIIPNTRTIILYGGLCVCSEEWKISNYFVNPNIITFNLETKECCFTGCSYPTESHTATFIGSDLYVAGGVKNKELSPDIIKIRIGSKQEILSQELFFSHDYIRRQGHCAINFFE